MSDEPKDKKPVDVTKIRKGSKVKKAGGQKYHVNGMFLSSDGPVLMVKKTPIDATCVNVPLSEIDELED